MSDLTDVYAASHKYQQLPLIPVQDFLQQHPEHTTDDENALMIARINHEHAEREALEQARQGLLKKKQGLIADNKTRKDDLANLDKDLEKFIDVSLSFVFASSRLTTPRPPSRSKRYSRRSTEYVSAFVTLASPKRSNTTFILSLICCLDC